MEKKKKVYENLQEFITKQRKLLLIERDSEIEDYQKLLSQNTSNDLEKLGICVNKLKLKSIKCGLYGRFLLTLAHQNYNSQKNLENANLANLTKLPENKIQSGDNVGIYKTNLNFSGKSLVSGVVFKKNEHKIVVSLDSKTDFSENQLSQEVLSIVIEVNEVTYNRYQQVLLNLDGIYSVIDHPSIHIVDVLLNGEDPKSINQNVSRKHLIDKIEDFHKKDLNLEQQESIEFCLKSETVGMVHGPPGTGKTMTICELIFQAVQHGMRVLACAPSNIAVDNIVERLGKTSVQVCRIGHPARMLPQICSKCLDNKVHASQGYKVLKDLKNQLNKQIRLLSKTTKYETKKELKALIRELRKEMKEIEKQSIREVIQDSQVICCTNTGAGDKVFKKNFCNIVFDIVVIDECAQALEVSCWLPILKGRRVFLAGDHKQLPPTIKSQKAQGLATTLFDRLLQDFEGADISRLLKVQYRMNTKIMEWSSQAVYQGQLRAHQSVANHTMYNLDYGGSNNNNNNNKKEVEQETCSTNQQQQQQQELLQQQQQNEEQKKDSNDINVQKQNNVEDIDNDNNSNTVLLFIDTADSSMGESMEDQQNDDRNKSKKNVGEADLVRVIFNEIVQQGIKEEDIGVITPYNAQVNEIKKIFETTVENAKAVEISTVDGFQGREKECIIISMVRSNPLKQVGFLKDFRRMNVAVTRARRFVCLIGDSETVSSDKFLKELLEYFKLHGEVRHSTEYMNDKDVRFGQGFVSIDKGKQDHNDGQTKQQKQQDKDQKKLKQQQQKQKESEEQKLEDKDKQQQQLQQEQDQSQQNEQQQQKHLTAKQLKKQKQIQKQKEQQENEKLNQKDDQESSEIQEDSNLKKDNDQQPQQKQVAEVEEDKDDYDNLKVKYTQQIEDFMKDESINELVYDSINALHRKVLHDIADEKKLIHSSKGNSKLKKLVISKKIEVKKEEITKKPANTVQNQQAQQQQKKKKEKKQAVPNEEDGMDEDKYLDEMIKQNKYCWHKDAEGHKCQTNVELMGVNCKFCPGRFCFKHNLPEDHGCGAAAKTFAREQFKQQQHQLLNQEKKLNSQQEQLLQRKLHDKISKAEDQRKAKKKEGKNEKK